MKLDALIQKGTLKMRLLSVACLLGLVLSGCTNEGAGLAEASFYYAQCRLAHGERCDRHAPDGATVETASMVAADDAVRVRGVVQSKDECENYASNAKPRAPGYFVQAVINQTVVASYGDGPLPSAIKSACADAPYRVSLTVAKAP